ncbi:hypothetical protein QBC39DRAFT_87656 [Podospora conica]|nr:hypothetical protein QBC39DRAFT_87656 [Schizothecium conicum]
MAFAADFHVPGAYRFDSTTRTGSGLNAGIFQPPRDSPSASTYNLAKSTGSLFSDISMSNTGNFAPSKRKRDSTRESTPVEWNMNMDGANDGRTGERPIAQGRPIRYHLAGQLNATPAGAPHGAENGILEDSVYSDVDYRRALGPKQMEVEAESPSYQFNPSPFGTADQPSHSSVGWSSVALNAIGEVVGKVWEFCKTGTFRGFHAGGGQGYDITPSGVTPSEGPPQPPPQEETPWGNQDDLPTFPNHDPLPEQAPSYFPQSNFTPISPAYGDLSTPESTPRPAAKRRQVSGHDDGLKKNWVLVDDKKPPQSFAAALNKATAAAARPGVPRARNSGYYTQTAASAGRRINVPVSRISTPHSSSTLPRGRPSLRISHTGSPRPATALREPASFAAPRSPVHRPSPSRIPVPVSAATTNPFALSAASIASPRPASRQSRIASPAPASSPTKSVHAHRRSINASAAPTMGRRKTAVEDITASPHLTPEAKQLAQKKLAADRDTDLRVDAFNMKLMSMIREAKEALGTSVEVMDEDGDGVGGGGGVGGWEDDEY